MKIRGRTPWTQSHKKNWNLVTTRLSTADLSQVTCMTQVRSVVQDVDIKVWPCSLAGKCIKNKESPSMVTSRSGVSMGNGEDGSQFDSSRLGEQSVVYWQKKCIYRLNWQCNSGLKCPVDITQMYTMVCYGLCYGLSAMLRLPLRLPTPKHSDFQKKRHPCSAEPSVCVMSQRMKYGSTQWWKFH